VDGGNEDLVQEAANSRRPAARAEELLPARRRQRGQALDGPSCARARRRLRWLRSRARVMLGSL